MATFYNQATLSYNGNTTTSNITTGELVEVLSATKTAVQTEYQQDDTLTYVVNILNSGNTTMTGVTISDNLGAYTLNTLTLVPMDYVVGTVRYYVGGVLQPTPTVTAGPPLTISGLSVPAKGNVTVIYQAKTNDYAPLAQESSITNTATINANNIANPITASATVNAYSEPVLRISKSLTPTTVSENGQLTYTFIIQNYGNTAADEAAALIVSDRFDPILNPITVAVGGTAWTEGTEYTYDATTGQFVSTAGIITVPAASYTQDAATGAISIVPGSATLTITGTV